MKALLLSVKSEWLAKILNGEKTEEVRKSFPKDFQGWCYLYCTKQKPLLLSSYYFKNKYELNSGNYDFENEEEDCVIGNGKVVCRFWYDSDEAHNYAIDEYLYSDNSLREEFYNKYKGELMSCKLEMMIGNTCLTNEQLQKYACENYNKNDGYAGRFCTWHISQLEIFDRQKELSEFSIKKAPQSYMFVEVEENGK